MLTRTSLGAEELFGAAIKGPPTVVRAAEKEGPKVLCRTKKVLCRTKKSERRDVGVRAARHADDGEADGGGPDGGAARCLDGNA
eukprot:5243812-Prymnesium_polylepis.1